MCPYSTLGSESKEQSGYQAESDATPNSSRRVKLRHIFARCARHGLWNQKARGAMFIRLKQWVVFVSCRIQGAGVSREPDSRKALGKSMSIAAGYSAVSRWVRCTKNISGFQVTCLFSRRLPGGGYRSLKLTLVFRTLHKQGSHDELLQRSREIVSRL